MLTYGELTEPERAVWDAIEAGRPVALPLSAAPSAEDPAAGASWGEDRQVRAQLLDELLTGRTGPNKVRPRALNLAGARIAGILNLEAASLICPLTLRSCWFDDVVNLDDAQASTIRLPGCRVPALTAKQLQTRGNVELSEGFTTHGEVRLLGAHIGGQLVLVGATLANANGSALLADGLTVDQDMICGDRFRAWGEVRLLGAHIGGELNFSGATLTNPTGHALTGDGLTVDQALFCAIGFTAKGELSLLGAHIGMQLAFVGATLTNGNGPALSADNLSVDQDMLCHGGFRAEGEVRLPGAHIGGQLSFVGASLTNRDGPALSAGNLTVGQDMLCHGEFRAEGEVRLPGAHIGGKFTFDGATLTNRDGPALSAEKITVNQSMLYQEGFRAEGEVRLLGAHIGGQLVFDDATLANPNGTALDLQNAQAGALILRSLRSLDGLVKFNDAHVGVLIDNEADWPQHLRLDGFVYEVLHEAAPIKVEARLRWLAHEDGYVPHPYEQLATVYRRMGRDEDARKIAIAKQRRRRDNLNWYAKIWNSLLRWTIGYGYRTWQAGLWLLGFLLIGWVVFARAYPTHLTPTAKPGEPSPHFQPFVYALDTLLPVVDLHQQDNWIPRGLAQWWAWISILAGWVLTTAVVAALTGLVKKD